MLEECTTGEQRSVVRFLWAKGLSAEDIHTETFPVYGGKCVPHKAVQNWVKKFFEGCLKVADDAWPGVEVAEVTVKRSPCCGF
jgi:hypothetical protein